MITSDFHMHTSFSGDSESAPRQMIEAAIDRGMETICFTDHIEQDYPTRAGVQDELNTFDVDRYFQCMSALQQEYAKKIDLRIGVEIGMQPHLHEYYKDLVNKYPFDFVIGSVHVIHGSDPYYGEMFESHTDEEIYQETFEATLENLEVIHDFDVLGHIDYVVRYGKEKAAQYSYAKYADYLDAILQKVIELGKGIELNMAGFKYGLDFAHPHPDILKRYHELGGEIITVGADGHKPEHIAYDFQKVTDILRASGFKYYTEFKARKPIFKQLT